MSDPHGEICRVPPTLEMPPQPKPARGPSPPPQRRPVTYYKSGALFTHDQFLRYLLVGSIAAFMLLFVGLFVD
ncbi:hypothetical protein P168DRAFT_320362 [Aspergillus campestris IBT 28561]|uniref:Uncharacterized protein n=1 Tax=Aspergillus campestris (strain IBT 28561) TaxID=1392248 RepID=A0A2I1CYW4_ASPC2|nr:uncharacterized protein P168DRAFT_320362 [Aspergillus campestris IBT 28561]PKY02822.1 hypothetical protein P168DRAFT_320362 [Aspergillus campestris IBT 28561]